MHARSRRSSDGTSSASARMLVVASLGLLGPQPLALHAHLADARAAAATSLLSSSLRAPALRLCAEPEADDEEDYDWATTVPEGGWKNYEWWEDGFSCVEYSESDGDVRLGVYTAYSIVNSEPHITPLCSADEDEGISALMCDEEVPAVPLDAVTRILDVESIFVSERNILGPSNPHGEHSEQVFDLREAEVSESVTLLVREGPRH